MINKEPELDREYFLSTKDEKGDFLIYQSDTFKLSEIDIINLIKICLIEIRSKSIGKKILAVYRDSNEHRKSIITEHLKRIGISEEADQNPTKLTKKTKTK
jgi:hypothetical protein